MPLARKRRPSPKLAAEPPALLRSLGSDAEGHVVAETLLEGTEEFLKSAAPRLTVSRRDSNRGVAFDLPTPDGAQYSFSLFPTAMEIAAQLLPPLDRAYFWYWPFRIQDYGSLASCEAAFFRSIGLILAYPTKIVQRRGPVSTRFNCYAHLPEAIEQVGGSVGSFLSISVPEICVRECTYSSPPVLTASVLVDGRYDR